MAVLLGLPLWHGRPDDDKWRLTVATATDADANQLQSKLLDLSNQSQILRGESLCSSQETVFSRDRSQRTLLQLCAKKKDDTTISYTVNMTDISFKRFDQWYPNDRDESATSSVRVVKDDRKLEAGADSITNNTVGSSLDIFDDHSFGNLPSGKYRLTVDRVTTNGGHGAEVDGPGNEDRNIVWQRDASGNKLSLLALF